MSDENLDRIYEMSKNLMDFAERGGSAKTVCEAATTLMSAGSALLHGEDAEHIGFRGNIMRAYMYSVKNGTYTSDMALKMFDDLAILAPNIDDSVLPVAKCAVCLEDRKVAEKFIGLTDKMLQKVETDGRDSIAGVEVIKACSKVVAYHPDMVRSCLSVVNRATDVQEADYDLPETLRAASDFCRQVCLDPRIESNGVKELARHRGQRYQQREEKIQDDEGTIVSVEQDRDKRWKKEYSKAKDEEKDFSVDFDYGR